MKGFLHGFTRSDLPVFFSQAVPSDAAGRILPVSEAAA